MSSAETQASPGCLIRWTLQPYTVMGLLQEVATMNCLQLSYCASCLFHLRSDQTLSSADLSDEETSISGGDDERLAAGLVIERTRRSSKQEMIGLA